MADKVEDDVDTIADKSDDDRDKYDELASKSRDEEDEDYDDDLEAASDDEDDDELEAAEDEDDEDDDYAASDDEPDEDDELAAAEAGMEEVEDDEPAPVTTSRYDDVENEAPREKLPPFPPAEERRGGSSMLGAVGIVMIGLVALAAFFMSLLDFFGLGPNNDGAANDVAGVTSEEAPLADVELASAEAEALRTAVDARLAELSGALQERTESLETEITDLRAQLAAVSVPPETAEPAAAPTVDLTGVEREIAELRSLVDTIQNNDQDARLASEITDLRGDIADVASRVAALGNVEPAGVGGPVVALSDLDADPIGALSAQIARLDRRVSDFNNTVVADLAQKVGRLDAQAPDIEGFAIKTADGTMHCRPTGGGNDAEFYCTPSDD